MDIRSFRRIELLENARRTMFVTELELLMMIMALSLLTATTTGLVPLEDS